MGRERLLRSSYGSLTQDIDLESIYGDICHILLTSNPTQTCLGHAVNWRFTVGIEYSRFIGQLLSGYLDVPDVAAPPLTNDRRGYSLSLFNSLIFNHSRKSPSEPSFGRIQDTLLRGRPTRSSLSITRSCPSRSGIWILDKMSGTRK